MKAFVLMDPLYEKPLGVFSSYELAAENILQLIKREGEDRRSHQFEIWDFELDAPAKLWSETLADDRAETDRLIQTIKASG